MKSCAKPKWKSASLASISEVFTDGNWIETKDQSAGGIRLVQTGNIGEGTFKNRRNKARWIDQETFFRLNCFEVLPGDCLISRLPDPVGRACLIPDTGDKMITAVDCSIVRPDDSRVDVRFLIYFTQTRQYLRDVDERCSGTTRRRISRKNLGKVLIPLPPLEEQRRIVAVLDEAFEGLARARAHAEANLQDIAQLYRSILSLEISGDTGRQGWQTIPLGEVCKLLNGRAYKKPELLDSGRYPVLRVGNFFTNNQWYFSDLELDEDKYCDEGDLLYAWSASFGPRIWKGGRVIYHYHIWKVLPSDRVNRDFLYYFFDWDKDLIKKAQGAGTTMIHVSKGSMEARAISLPPLEEQRRIVAVLDEAFESLARARARAEAKLQDLNDLRQSLLQKAFTGELT